jgi:hypothetical protein
MTIAIIARALCSILVAGLQDFSRPAQGGRVAVA